MPVGVYLRTDKHIDSLRKSHLGKSSGAKGCHWRHTKEAKIKIGLASAGRKPSLGKFHTKEWKEKMKLWHKINGTGKWMKGRKGNNHPRYIQDRFKLKISDNRLNDVLGKEWRKLVIKRDRYKCKINDCDCYGKLEVHHILSWRDYPELRYKINNGIVLCHFHHPREWKEERRLIPVFQDLVVGQNNHD